MMNEQIKFYAVRVCQPLGDFYIGKMDGCELYECSSADVRDMKNDDIGQRLGIQRELKSSRVKEIKEYVKTVDACFPNSIILSTDRENVIDIREIVPNAVYEFIIRKTEKTFQIIDGQHRIAGLENYESSSKFEINVSLFVEMDIEQQAILFSTINIKQAKVSKSLSFELMAIQSTRNPIKSAHYIGRILSRETGALHGRITSLSVINKEEGYTITQAAFIQRVIKYISGNEIQLIKDRDILKEQEIKNCKTKLIYANEKMRQKLIFRNLFIDERDSEIAAIILNYFNAINKRWPEGWNNDNYVLKKTIGFNALMVFLRDVTNYIGKYDTVISEDEFFTALNLVNIEDEEWSLDNNFQLSGYGQSDIIKLLRERFSES